MADSFFATADLLQVIKDLDTIECGEEARKHFNFASSYRNLNHGMLIDEYTLELILQLQFVHGLPGYVADSSHQVHSAPIPPKSNLSFAVFKILQRRDQMSSSDTTIPICLTSRARPSQSSSMLR